MRMHDLSITLHIKRNNSMMRRTKLFLFFTIVLSSFAHNLVSAVKKPYIVYLGAHSHGRDASFEDYKLATESHYELLGSHLRSKEKAQNAMIYSYTKSINGFAAHLEEKEAKQLEEHPDVISVFESKRHQLHTTRSWEFMHLGKDGQVLPNSLWSNAKLGEDVIIANLDSGVWPESKSFSDEGMGPVPLRWRGSCENNTDIGVRCNRKLIGAKYFNKGMLSLDPILVLINSTRDTNGHGSHTLSTAAGRLVPGVSTNGYANGTAAGGSPNARVAAYKVCWSRDCEDTDILAGFDEAIHDGVDVISISLGGSPMTGAFNKTIFFYDAITLGSIHAAMHGVTVVCSAGNGGAGPSTVVNTAPWIITVAASTLDRAFTDTITLGNNKLFKGLSMETESMKLHEFYPLINGSDAASAGVDPYYAEMCGQNTLDPNKVKGKIVICTNDGFIPLDTKGDEALRAGAAGMILANPFYMGKYIYAYASDLPSTMITFADAVALYSYMNSTKTPVATISPAVTELGAKPAPAMADFSSRGPGGPVPQILKPDITAPGVDILAAYTGFNGSDTAFADSPYVLLSGTSMSCPHVSGVVGLLKAMYPGWSHAAIKSAIMTTASTRDNTGTPIKDFDDNTTAIPFAYGAGHVQPNRAMYPGLVYDMTMDHYFNFLCTLGFTTAELGKLSRGEFKCPAEPVKLEDLNYPSITVPQLNKTFTVTRTVTNVGPPGIYRARVRAPIGITVTVNPPVLVFKRVHEKKVFTITFESQKEKLGSDYVFGRLVWSDGLHRVRSPLAVKAL